MTSFNTGATGSNGNVFAASFGITIPAGVLAGDVLFVVFAAFAATGTVVSATSTGTAPVQIGTTASTTFSGSTLLAGLFSVVAGAADAGKVITGAVNAGTANWAAALGAWTGASNVTPVDVSGVATASGASSTITCPTRVTGVAGDWALQIVAAALGGATFTGGAGFTQRERVVDGSSGAAGLIYDSNAAVGPAGTSIGGAQFANAGNNSWWAGWTVGLAPAVAAAKGGLLQVPDDKPHLKKLLYLV